MSMLIAIDYDNTYSADPALWEAFAASARAAGHGVVICTGRAFEPRIQTSLQIFCAAGLAKAEYLAAQGLHPTVWIDDDPTSVNVGDPSTQCELT